MVDNSIKNEISDSQRLLVLGKRKRKIQRATFIISFLIIPLIQFAIFYLYININTFPIAFQRKNAYFNKVEWVGWANFKKVISHIKHEGEVGLLGRATWNSILYFIFNTFVMSPMSVILSFFIWKKMPGYKIFRFTFLIPSILPGVVLPMLFAFMLDSTTGVLTPFMRKIGLGKLVPQNGWLGTYKTAQSMIIFYMLWSGSGMTIMLFCGNLNRMPSEVFESARLDGIKLFQELWYLVIPMMMPLLSMSIWTGVSAILGYYLTPMLLTKGGPGGTTKTIAYVIMDWTTGGEETVGAAAGLLYSCITIPLVFSLKTFLEKITPEVAF